MIKTSDWSLLKEFLGVKLLWNAKASEKQACVQGVIQDFVKVIQDYLDLYHELLCRKDDDDHKKVMHQSKRSLCEVLSGSNVRILCGEESSDSYQRFGGFDFVDMEIVTKIAPSFAAKTLFEASDLHLKGSCDSFDYIDTFQRSIARGFLSWLGTKSNVSLAKYLSQKVDVSSESSPTLQQITMEANLYLLSSKSTHVQDISLTTLYVLNYLCSCVSFLD